MIQFWLEFHSAIPYHIGRSWERPGSALQSTHGPGRHSSDQARYPRTRRADARDEDRTAGRRGRAPGRRGRAPDRHGRADDGYGRAPPRAHARYADRTAESISSLPRAGAVAGCGLGSTSGRPGRALPHGGRPLGRNREEAVPQPARSVNPVAAGIRPTPRLLQSYLPAFAETVRAPLPGKPAHDTGPRPSASEGTANPEAHR